MAARSSREWDSDAYDRVSAPQFSWGKRVLDRLSVRGDEFVLDAGCGTGRLTGELVARLSRGGVVAVDISENMLRAARKHLAPRFGRRVQFIACDLQDLPFRAAFDGIFSTAAFHWVPDHDRLFRSLFDALRRGGWLFAQSGGGPNLAHLLARVSALCKRQPYAACLAGYSYPWVYAGAETTAERLLRAGFIEIETSLEPAPTRFEEATSYCEFVSKVILHRHLERLPDSNLRHQLMDDLARQAATDNPPFELDYWRLNLRGRRPD